ncbi:hypothetical protein FACS1894187_15940 [Synergistales bacterium]|nr:hypothetical protein FACS1894187_15940 [Synergistales bacterium]
MGMGTSNRRLATIQPVEMTREPLRLAIQNKLDSKKSISERRRLGQFATPSGLARDIVSFGLTLHNDELLSFLDPAFGTGAFYSALVDSAELNNISYAKGIEIDPYYGLPAKKIWADMKIDLELHDFTKLEPEYKYNFIICNPPYVRHHLMDTQDKIRIKEKTYQASGIKLSGLAGLYCHFLLQSYQWMADDGIAGWLVPSEFMDVNYGKEIKQFLLSHVELLRIHRFDPSDVQFDDALVSSAVVWFRKHKPIEESNVEFSFGGTMEKPKIVKFIDRQTLKHESKWTRFPQMSVRTAETMEVRLSDYFTVKRGVATGNNNFFIMNREKIEALGLPFEFFRPVLPSSRYVHEIEIFADDIGNPVLPQELFLLDCRLSENEVQEKYPILWSYLESGKDSVSKGYLCKARKCWYYQEHRDAPPYICTYMGRDNTVTGMAFRFILNHSNAIVTNSYLALYPKKNLLQKIVAMPDLKRTIWKMLNDMSPERLNDEGRIYGGGLRKIEPAELLNVPIPQIAEILA